MHNSRQKERKKGRTRNGGQHITSFSLLVRFWEDGGGGGGGRRRWYGAKSLLFLLLKERRWEGGGRRVGREVRFRCGGCDWLIPK